MAASRERAPHRHALAAVARGPLKVGACAKENEKSAKEGAKGCPTQNAPYSSNTHNVRLQRIARMLRKARCAIRLCQCTSDASPSARSKTEESTKIGTQFLASSCESTGRHRKLTAILCKAQQAKETGTHQCEQPVGRAGSPRADPRGCVLVGVLLRGQRGVRARVHAEGRAWQAGGCGARRRSEQEVSVRSVGVACAAWAWRAQRGRVTASWRVRAAQCRRLLSDRRLLFERHDDVRASDPREVEPSDRAVAATPKARRGGERSSRG
eukprot:6036845-Pleurochrysis_carterae.AAC.1